ncbi:hypothetical protein [Persicirhabdus sediminis]|uniref:Uncharacterized protein n=1 Tax=Persicirhabdus sediminis TaxID=454144 RepID=A0A8J7SGZ5_9BACT|nr:hypothetical protein [Persicirhabdus sediminis]MBK1789536.1 hypothetical protein [Persicirhabdus sediminis]
MRVITYITISILLLVSGWFFHLILKGEDTPAYHWRKLAQLEEHMKNPENHGSSMGFKYISVPFDDTPHLEALVAANELEKREVLIPGLPVSKENTEDWMAFANHPEVIQAIAQGDYYDGEVPLSFSIWFRPAFAESVDAYIAQLHQMANKAQHPTASPPN